MQQIIVLQQGSDPYGVIQSYTAEGFRLVEVQNHIDGDRMIFSDDAPIKSLKEQYASAKTDSERLDVIARRLGLKE